MIKNGNYKWVDIDKLKANFKEGFTEFFGEENKEYIDRVLDNIHYTPYHTFDYISQYYDRFILRFKDDIIKNFHSKVDLPASVDNIIFPEGIECLSDSPFYITDNILCMYKTSDLNKKWREQNPDATNAIKNTFNTFGLRFNKTNAKKLQDFYTIFDNSLREIEKNNPCDVFNDIDTVEKNYNNATYNYLNYAIKYLVLSDNDKKILEDKEHLCDNIDRLDCNSLLFNDSIVFPGLILAFTSISNNLINTKDSKCNDNQLQVKYLLMYQKLKYLLYSWEEENNFKYMSLDDFNMLTNPVSNKKDLKRLESLLKKEYEYQMRNVNNRKFLIPTKIADVLEIKRDGYVNSLYNNCKFQENLNSQIPFGFSHDSESSTQFFTLPNFQKNKLSGLTNHIYFCEDEQYDANDRMSNLTHEMLHALSSQFIITSYKDAILRMGLSTESFSTFGDNIISGDSSTIKMSYIMENINERLTQEILPILTKKLKMKLPSGDIQIETKKFDTLYTYSNFLTEEFYSLFKPYIKKIYVDETFDFILPEQHINAFTKLKNNITHKYPSRPHSDNNMYIGAVDYDKLEQLNNLVGIWQNNIDGNNAFVSTSSSSLTDGSFITSLPAKERDLYYNLLEKKNNIIKGMIKDLKDTYSYEESDEILSLLDEGNNINKYDPLINENLNIEYTCPELEEK